MAAKRKRNALDLVQKFSIITEIESGRKQSAVAVTYSIAKTTVNTIWADREKIKRAYETSPTNNRKRLRTATYEDVEEAVLKWFQTARSQNVPINGQLMREKALTFANKLNHESFQCSGGWLDRFKARHGVVFRTICGEAAAVDDSVVATWLEKSLPQVIAAYEPRDIFNADETGVFYRLLPDKTLCFKNDTCHGGKQSKERITAMVCANMDGSEKLPLMVIGKFERPRCFKNIKTLPLNYKFNKKAWMTGRIFEDWLRALDKQFKRQCRNVLMMVDNCPAHPHLEKLDAIKLVFLPPNATSRLQPCDMGIIKNLKVKYRRLIALRLIKAVENKTAYDINILDAMHMLRNAWADVKPQTITNCFHKAGLETTMCRNDTQSTETTDGESRDEFDDDDDLPLSHFLPAGVTFDEYAAVDEAVETCELPTDDEIIADIQAAANQETVTETKSDDEDDNDGLQSLPTRADAAAALETLQQYLLSESNSEAAQLQLMSIERFITCKSRRLTQRSMTDFMTVQRD